MTIICITGYNAEERCRECGCILRGQADAAMCADCWNETL